MGDFLQNAWPVLLNPAKVTETKQVWETVTAKESLKTHDEHMSRGALHGILEREKVEQREPE